MKSAASFVWCLIVSVFLTGPLAGQSYSYTNYTTKDGLPSNTIHGLIQDNDGFMWFATENGLCRFDGTHFKTFTQADGLPSNEVLGVNTDPQNRLWIICFKPVLCYYKDGKIHNPENDSLLRKMVFENGLIEDLSFGKEGSFFSSYTNRYFVKGNTLYHYEKDSAAALKHLHLWDYIYYKPAKEKTTPFPAGVVLPDNKDSAIIKPFYTHDKAPTYYLFYSELSHYTNGSIITWISIPGKQPYKLVQQQVRTVISLSDSTILLFDRNLGAKQYNVFTRKFTDDFLSDRKVHSVYADHEGNLWFTTRQTGVFRLNRGILHYRFGEPNYPQDVHHIQKTGGVLYVGSTNGHLWKVKKDGSSVLVKNPRSLLLLNQQNKMINFSGSNFFALKRITEIYAPFSLKTAFLFGDSILSSSSSEASVGRINSPTARRIVFKKRSTSSILYDNMYYVATLEGLYTVDRSGHITYLGNKEPLLNSRISFFALGNDGILWIATYEKGIVGYKNGKVQVHISTAKGGLSSNSVRCLYLDGTTLWAGTEKGLDKIDSSPGSYKVLAHYGEQDGLDSEIINTIYTDSGTVYVGTGLGLNFFREADIPKHESCRLQLLAITVSGKQKKLKEDSFTLPSGDNNIRFDYAGISFRSAGQMNYKYRLLGLSTDWEYTTESALSYPTLPAGRYVLQIMAINRFGDQSPLFEQHFEIEQVLWKKNWVRALVLVLFLVLVWLFTQWRILRVRKNEKEKRLIQKRLAELEHMALRAQMNPHFIFNCMSSIQHYILSHDAESANYYMTRFASLMRQTLDNAPKLYISLAEEINYLNHYLELEQLQTDVSFEFMIVVEPGIDPEKTMVPNMVIQPYVENAVKHGVSRLKEKGRIELNFRRSREPGVFECCIEDNGPGIEQASNRKYQNMPSRRSHGIYITTSRIDLLNQLQAGSRQIRIEACDLNTEHRAGTRVCIYFPF